MTDYEPFEQREPLPVPGFTYREPPVGEPPLSCEIRVYAFDTGTLRIWAEEPQRPSSRRQLAIVDVYPEHTGEFVARLVKALGIDDDHNELRDKRTDLLNIRGILSPQDRSPSLGPVVPMPLGDEVAPAVEWLANERDRLTADVKQLREQLEVTRRVGEAETARAAYEAMDTERRGWESRRAVENVTLADLRRDHDRYHALVERALDLRMHGERALTGPTWRQWDRDAETALRAGEEETGSDPESSRATCRHCAQVILRSSVDDVWFSKGVSVPVTSDCNDAPDGTHAPAGGEDA